MNEVDAILYACGSGKQKQWARETIIMEYLKNNKPECANYLYIQDINKLPKVDEEKDGKLIYRFGYLYRVPRTEIDLLIDIKTGRIEIKEDDFMWGKEEVLEKVFNMLKEQINTKNLYIKTNLNDNRFLIK